MRRSGVVDIPVGYLGVLPAGPGQPRRKALRSQATSPLFPRRSLLNRSIRVCTLPRAIPHNGVGWLLGAAGEEVVRVVGVIRVAGRAGRGRARVVGERRTSSARGVAWRSRLMLSGYKICINTHVSLGKQVFIRLTQLRRPERRGKNKRLDAARGAAYPPRRLGVPGWDTAPNKHTARYRRLLLHNLEMIKDS